MASSIWRKEGRIPESAKILNSCMAWPNRALEVVSKPHLRPNGCVAPQGGIRI
jgi:hypothetical protein